MVARPVRPTDSSGARGQSPTTVTSRGKLVRSSSAARIDIDGREVLDADPGLAIEVDTGLDGEHGRRWQGCFRRGPSERGQLVGGQPDAVPGAVAEVVAVAGSFDDLTSGGVDLTIGDRIARRDAIVKQGDGSGLGLRDQRIDVPIERRRLAHEEGPGHIRAVAIDLGAEVEEQHLARDDRPIAWRAVWQRGART